MDQKKVGQLRQRVQRGLRGTRLKRKRYARAKASTRMTTSRTNWTRRVIRRARNVVQLIKVGDLLGKSWDSLRRGPDVSNSLSLATWATGQRRASCTGR